MADRTQFLHGLERHRWVLEPALAVLLFVAWFAWGHPFALEPAIAMLSCTAAVGVSRVLPVLSVGLAWIGVAAARMEGAVWMPVRLLALVAVAAALFGIASHGSVVLRWIGFGSALIWSPLLAYTLTQRGGITLPQFGPTIGGYYTSQGLGLVLISLMVAMPFAAAWLLGYQVARQRAVSAMPGGPSSVLMWLAFSGGTRVTEDAPDSAGLVRRLTLRQTVADLVWAAVFLIFSVYVDAFRGAVDSGVGIYVTVVFAAAVALRRASPAVALSLVWLGAVLQMTNYINLLASDIAVPIVLYATAAFGDRVVRLAGLISAGLGAVVASLYLSVTDAMVRGYYELSWTIVSLLPQFAFVFLVSALVLGLSWVLGLLVRTMRNARYSRRAQAAAEHERNRAEEDVVVEQERTRIARDMHDVVAHTLAVVIAQADGARYARHADPEAADEALKTIAATARSALTDVRVLLAELRHAQPEGPQPTLADVDRTVDQIRAAGLPVTIERSEEPHGLGAAQQIAAYRIVQEALTNALRHGDTSQPASVRFVSANQVEQGAGLIITVRNSMKTAPLIPSGTGALARVGHGLPGMRERASLAGGSLTAGPADGAFVVSAFLPAGTAPSRGADA